MGAVGGSLGSISFNGRPFSVDGDADVAQQLKKFENEIKINGNGDLRLIKKRIAQMLESIPLAIDDAQGDLEFLSDLNDNGDGAPDGLFNVVVGMPSGAIYAGRGQFVGDIKRQTGEATAEVSLNLKNMKVQ